MKLLPFLILTLFAITLSCSSSKKILDFGYPNYAEVNPLLQLGSKSLVRYSSITLEMHQSGVADYTEQKAITIFDEDHDGYAQLVISYDNLSEIHMMKANVRNKNGVIIKSFSMKDAADFSDYDGFSFYTDNRIKVLNLTSNSYPYTIEYEFRKSYRNTLNLPNWFPQQPNQAVEFSTFKIIDHNTGVRYYKMNFGDEPEITEVNGTKSYTWSTTNKLALQLEPLAPYQEILPFVLIAPGSFAIDGNTGNASTWQDFGKWYYELGANTRELPDAAKAEVDALVDGITDEEEKVRILYNYLQEKNRYVSIQLGIGGWKPFTAGYVFENSYGDCKALTNYMHAILEYVGIKAEAVLISINTSRALIEEFPSNQFNHVRLLVTLENGKQIWLENTSKYLPPDNTGDEFTKKGLLVNSEGGRVIETPLLGSSKNKTQRFYEISLSNDGNAVLEADVSYSGVFQNSILNQLMPISEADRIQWLESTIDVSNRKVTKADFSQLRQLDSLSVIQFEAQLGNYANNSVKRLFLPVNSLNTWKGFIPEKENRRQPVEFKYAFSEVDSSIITIPDELDVEFMPNNVHLSFNYGHFYFNIQQKNDNQFVITRSLEMTKRRIDAEEYTELKDFLDEVRKADAQQIVLVRSSIQ